MTLPVNSTNVLSDLHWLKGATSCLYTSNSLYILATNRHQVSFEVRKEQMVGEWKVVKLREGVWQNKDPWSVIPKDIKPGDFRIVWVLVEEKKV